MSVEASYPRYGSVIVSADGRVKVRWHEMECERDSFIWGFNRLPDKMKDGRTAMTEKEYRGG